MKSEQDPAAPTASNKRRVLVAGLGAGLCAAAAGIWKWPTEPEPAVSKPRPPRSETGTAGQASTARETAESQPAGAFTREAFLPLLKTQFGASNGQPGGMSLKLVEVSAATILAHGPVKFSSFSLLFEAPQGSPAEGAIYRVSHPQVEEMDLFLSPVGRTFDRVCYEAAFTQKI